MLASPVEDRLFCAGEATSIRSCSTVPTAIETGVRVADQVCHAAGVLNCNLVTLIHDEQLRSKQEKKKIQLHCAEYRETNNMR